MLIDNLYIKYLELAKKGLQEAKKVYLENISIRKGKLFDSLDSLVTFDNKGFYLQLSAFALNDQKDFNYGLTMEQGGYGLFGNPHLDFEGVWFLRAGADVIENEIDDLTLKGVMEEWDSTLLEWQ